MGKKLTEEQKAANKEAAKLKRKAFERRKKELDAARERIEAEHGLPDLAAAADAASAERDAVWKRGDDRISELRRQFEAKMAEMKAEHDAAFEVARKASDAAYRAKRDAESAVKEALKSQFPDMFNRYGYEVYGQSVWTPPPGYMDGADARRKDGGQP